jgi:hypothetical protein
MLKSRMKCVMENRITWMKPCINLSKLKNPSQTEHSGIQLASYQIGKGGSSSEQEGGFKAIGV